MFPIAHGNEVMLVARIIFGGYFISTSEERVNEYSRTQRPSRSRIKGLLSFILNGILQFTHASLLMKYAAAKRIPGAHFFIYASGVAVIVGGLMVMAGGHIPKTAIALVVILIPLTIVMHTFWNISHRRARFFARSHVLSNATLLIVISLALL